MSLRGRGDPHRGFGKPDHLLGRHCAGRKLAEVHLEAMGSEAGRREKQQMAPQIQAQQALRAGLVVGLTVDHQQALGGVIRSFSGAICASARLRMRCSASRSCGVVSVPASSSKRVSRL